MSDLVNRPAHYTRGSIEVRDFISDQGLNFNRGSAVKYIARAGHKDRSREVEDLEKAISCLKHEIERIANAKRDRIARFKEAGLVEAHGQHAPGAPCGLCDGGDV